MVDDKSGVILRGSTKTKPMDPGKIS